MVAVDQRIVQFVVLVGKLNGRLRKNDSLFHAVALGKGAGGNVADDDLQRHDGDLFDQRLTVVQLPDKMRGNAVLLQKTEQEIRHPVVHHAFSDNRPFFQSVQRGCIVLVGDDHKRRIIGSINLLCLSFVELFCFFHLSGSSVFIG